MSRVQLFYTAMLLGGALLGAVLSAQLPPTPPPSVTANDQSSAEAPEEPREEEEPVRIERADFLKYDPEQNVYYLTGNVHFIHKDTHLYCDEAEYNDDKETARAVGNLKLVQAETTVTGDLMTADFNEEVAEVIGNVRLITKKKKEANKKESETAGQASSADQSDQSAEKHQQSATGESDAEKSGRWDEYKEKLTTITCDKLSYWYEAERAIATGNIVVEQDDKVCYAEEAEYVEADDLLTLKGNPVRVVMESGNTFQTPWIKVEVEGERFWTGGFTGVFKREKKDETTPETDSAPPTQPPESSPQPSPPPE
ncbi:MAG: OstA-like protein [Candidatus Zipacnadales bacterium]